MRNRVQFFYFFMVSSLLSLSFASQESPLFENDKRLPQEVMLARYHDDQVIEILQELIAKREIFQESPELLLNRMRLFLRQLIDVPYFVKGITRSIYRDLSPDQIEAFNQAFEQKLFRTYLNALLSIETMPELSSKWIFHPRNKYKANLLIDAKLDSKKIKMTYKMYQNPDGKWLVRNMIIEGINVGILLKNDFESALQEKSGNIDALINSWNHISNEESEN